MNEHAAVEGRDWFCEGKRLNQHFDAERRPTAGKGECDVSISKALHGVDRSGGQHLLLRDQSAVDIGYNQANIAHKTPHSLLCNAIATLTKGGQTTAPAPHQRPGESIA